MTSNPVRKVASWIAKLKSDGDQASTPSNARPERPQRQERLSAALSSEELDRRRQKIFEQRLRRLLRPGETVTSGRLLVLNFENIKLQLGDRWAETVDRIHDLITGIFERRLASDDFFTRSDELNYVVVFGSLSSEAAKIKIHAIAKEIIGKIFGADRGLEQLKIRSAVCEANGDIVLQEEDCPSSDNLRHLAS